MSTTFAQLYFPAITEHGQLAELLRLMCRSDALTPARYDEVEPIRQAFNVNQIDAIAERLVSANQFYWTGTRGAASGSIRLRSGKGKQTASLSIWTDVERLSNPEELTGLIRDTVTRFGASYGYVHYLSQQEMKKLAGADTVLGGDGYNPPMMSVTRWKLVRCLPNLYWANVFGPEYVALFGGSDRVASAPAQIVGQLAPDTFYLQLTGDMLDFSTHHAEVDALRERTKQYLGADCFFDYESGFNGTYRVPNLGWEEPARPPLRPELLMKRLGR